MLLVMLFVVPSFVFAEMPAKEGFIHDNGGMLTDSEIASIEAEIDRAPFSLYLYTLESLGDSSIGDITKQIYQHWELAGSDVLLVIAKEEREVHIEIASGSSFDKAIMEALRYRGNNQYTQFLDEAFIPYAIDGDFRQATVSVITQLQMLRDAMEVNQGVFEGNQPGSNGSSVGEEVIGGVDSGVGSGKESVTAMGAGIYIAFIIILCIALVVYLFVRKNKLLVRKRQLITEYQAVLGSIHTIEQELTPMVRLSQGKSKEYLKTLQDRFYHLLQEVSQQLTEVEAIDIPVWVTMKQINAIDNLDKKNQNNAIYTKEIKDGITQYKDMEAKASKVLGEAKRDWDTMHLDLQKQKEQLGYPLDVLDKKNTEIKQVLERCDHLIIFDPESVTDIIRELPERIKNIQVEISELQGYITISSQLPEKLQRVRNDMDERIQREGLLLSEIQPYAFYDHVDEQFRNLQEALKEGNVIVSRSIVESIKEWIEDGLQQIENTIRARDWNQKTIVQARKDIEQYDKNQIEQLNSKLVSLKESYSSNHWSDIPNKIELIVSGRPLIEKQLLEAEEYSDSKIQKYFAAEKLLQAVLERLKEMADVASCIFSLEANLDREYEQMTLDIGQYERELERAKNRSSQLFSTDIQAYSEQMAQSIHQTRISLLQLPRDIDDCSKMLKEVVSSFAQLEQAINITIKEKQAAENSAADFNQAFQAALTKCRSHVSVSKYEHELTQYHSDAQKAIEIGQYTTVYVVIEKGKTLIKEMEKEYLAKREQERRRREAELRRQRQTAATLSRSTSRPSSVGTRGGNSGFSSRGSSGGGSSFGSSGSRGGGSSFKSGGSRGGGSKW